MQVDSLKKGKVKGKGKHQNQKGNRTTSTTSTRARTVAELDIGRRTAGDQVEERTTIPPVTTATLSVRSSRSRVLVSLTVGDEDELEEDVEQ